MFDLNFDQVKMMPIQSEKHKWMIIIPTIISLIIHSDPDSYKEFDFDS